MARIGVMGCGSVADFGHIPHILQTPGLELTAVFDPNDLRARFTADKFGIPKWFTNQDAFLSSGLDAVVVCSPATAHPINVLAAADHRLHVLCEKPLALSDIEAETMIAAMERAERMLLVGFVYRFSPVATQIKQWLAQGLIGEARSLRLIYIWDLHGQYEMLADGSWVESPMWRGRMLEGGPMIDCGVHMIDLARWWLGQDVVGFTSAGAWVDGYAAPDHVYLNMDHEGGAHTMVEMSFTYGHTARFPAPQFSYDIIGTGGMIHYDRNGWLLEARTGTDKIVGQGASEKNFAGMHAAFAEALRTGEPGDFPSARDGLRATQIARAATEEAVLRRPQAPPPPLRSAEPARQA